MYRGEQRDERGEGRGIEYNERARVGRQKLKRRAEIERQSRRARSLFPGFRAPRFGRWVPERGNGSVAYKLKTL